ncbi:phosphoribosyl-dephospho-CoA transferase [Nocardiopsis mwathae]|uniref:Phosphoribosyl-dephospho-CoA transferase n=1 Tax=Nocardiopsis mwathae TaxID=1472723 RepID=A0A7X0D586_9ACTN|nr:phosphoribosyl-dephospho-CoA transferase [Nocardiopsis mwathae]
MVGDEELGAGYAVGGHGTGTLTGYRAHDLLRFDDPGAVLPEGPESDLPLWAVSMLRDVPWVVVRRGIASAGTVPVGIRGVRRADRVAAFLPESAVVDRVTPEQAARSHPRLPDGRRAAVPALGVLTRLDMTLRRHVPSWGIGGSAGFEIVTGLPVTLPGSDLDVVIRPRGPIPLLRAATLLADLRALPVRVDVQLASAAGAFTLVDYARGGPVLVRPLDGSPPRMAEDPWADPSDRPSPPRVARPREG